MNLSSKRLLERDLSTRNSWKNRDSGEVGLAIIASLEKKYPARSARKVLISLNININMMKGLEAKCDENVHHEKTKYPALDYLSFCYMCGKRLDGKDIYMYRGEKAFCSPECRCEQISKDEYQERKCRSSFGVSSSSSQYSDRLFFTSIEAA
ncbi:Zf-FLZ domain-containing protein [Dioscorea alata]|uniref:Zf-FLZ domain-containing protein n=1 Tax=Dioscorea alata TaxID=55571 RepID=A0ACB7U514_DIOAL|nr:Zf-FLZ domain-containing protein [Dioscorea alata]